MQFSLNVRIKENVIMVPGRVNRWSGTRPWDPGHPFSPSPDTLHTTCFACTLDGKYVFFCVFEIRSIGIGVVGIEKPTLLKNQYIIEKATQVYLDVKRLHVIRYRGRRYYRSMYTTSSRVCVSPPDAEKDVDTPVSLDPDAWLHLRFAWDGRPTISL
jgi:hypothetical protein